MRVILIFLFIAGISFPTLSQDLNGDYKTRTRYEDKIESYLIMEKVGTNLAISGGLASVAGLYLLSDSNWVDDSASSTSDDTAGVLGVMLLSKGIPLAVMGLVFRTVGINSQRKYQEKLDKLSIGPSLHPQATGITISYTF